MLETSILLKLFLSRVFFWNRGLAKTLGYDVISLAVRNLGERVIGKSEVGCTLIFFHNIFKSYPVPTLGQQLAAAQAYANNS